MGKRLFRNMRTWGKPPLLDQRSSTLKTRLLVVTGSFLVPLHRTCGPWERKGMYTILLLTNCTRIPTHLCWVEHGRIGYLSSLTRSHRCTIQHSPPSLVSMYKREMCVCVCFHVSAEVFGNSFCVNSLALLSGVCLCVCIYIYIYVCVCVRVCLCVCGPGP